MGTLSNFISTVNTYGVRTQNLFAVRVTFPNLLTRAMGALDGESSTRVNWHRLANEMNNNLFCYGQGFEIPERTITYGDAFYQGYGVPVPAVMKFGTTHNMQFNDDLSGSIRRILMLWQNATINGNVTDGNFEGNRFTGDPSTGYGANMKIYLLSNEYDGKAPSKAPYAVEGGRIGYELKGVTVGEIGKTTLSNQAAQIATLPITFRSQYWVPFEYTKNEIEGLMGRTAQA